MSLRTRLKNAIRAFKGQPVAGSITFGLDVKRCSECEHKQDHSFRDNLLVTSGARVAYMNTMNHISIPDGIDGEHEVAMFISKVVDSYLCLDHEMNFDEFIEEAIQKKYRT